MYHPFPLGVYVNCVGNESSLTDCHAAGTLQCTFYNTARVQCAGEMVTGIMEIEPPLKINNIPIKSCPSMTLILYTPRILPWKKIKDQWVDVGWVEV